MALAVDVFKVTKVVANPILYIFLLRSIDYNFRFRIVLSVNYANTVILDKYDMIFCFKCMDYGST